MYRFGVFLFLLAAGIGAAIQPAVNAKLGQIIGKLEAGLVNGIVALVVIILLTVPFGDGNLVKINSLPWYYFIGGFFGAMIVLSFIWAVPVYGVTFSIALIITAELVTAVLVDHFGFMGAYKTPVNLHRIIGVVLLVVGTRLVLR